MIEYEIHAGIGHKSPYMEALTLYLKEYGIEVKYMPYLPCRKPEGEERIIHIHRIGRLYSSDNMDSLNKLLNQIDELKEMGWFFVWTIHNIFPIDSLMTEVDFIAAAEIGKRMDVVFCHTEIMKNNLKMHFNINAINHGYGADYHLSNGQHSEIDSLWKRNRFTFGFIGNIREYKGIVELLETYDRFLDEGHECDLIIAGSPYAAYLDDNPKIVDLINKNKVILYDKYVYKEDWDYLIKNVDVLVFPYKIDMPVFKFGFYASSIAQAVYMKKAIICPQNDNLEAIIGNLDYSFTYDYQTENGLYNCMKECMNTDTREKNQMEEASYKMVSHCTWKNLANHIVVSYSEKGIERK